MNHWFFIPRQSKERIERLSEVIKRRNVPNRAALTKKWRQKHAAKAKYEAEGNRDKVWNKHLAMNELFDAIEKAEKEGTEHGFNQRRVSLMDIAFEMQQDDVVYIVGDCSSKPSIFNIRASAINGIPIEAFATDFLEDNQFEGAIERLQPPPGELAFVHYFRLCFIDTSNTEDERDENIDAVTRGFSRELSRRKIPNVFVYGARLEDIDPESNPGSWAYGVHFKRAVYKSE